MKGRPHQFLKRVPVYYIRRRRWKGTLTRFYSYHRIKVNEFTRVPHTWNGIHIQGTGEQGGAMQVPLGDPVPVIATLLLYLFLSSDFGNNLSIATAINGGLPKHCTQALKPEGYQPTYPPTKQSIIHPSTPTHPSSLRYFICVCTIGCSSTYMIVLDQCWIS